MYLRSRGIHKLIIGILPPKPSEAFFGESKRGVAILSLDPTNLIHTTLKEIESYLETNLTDPESGSRPSDSKFIMTNFPHRKQHYPHVILSATSGAADPECVNAPISFKVDLLFTIQVFSKNTKQLDEICGEILADMINGVGTFRDFGMHAMRIPVLFHNNPMTPDKVHSKLAEWAFYTHISQTV